MPLPAGALYHWVGEGGWVYKKDNTYYYLSLSTNGWDNTQEELEDVVNGKKTVWTRGEQRAEEVVNDAEKPNVSVLNAEKPNVSVQDENVL